MAFIGSAGEIAERLGSIPGFVEALAFVAECRKAGSPPAARLAALAERESERVDLSGDCHAMLMAYRTRGRDAGRFETHVRFIDVQAIVSGAENMALEDRAGLEVVEDRSAERDAIFYRDRDGGSVLRLDESNLAVFFPADAHLGGIAADAPVLIRKVVVKVPVA